MPREPSIIPRPPLISGKEADDKGPMTRALRIARRALGRTEPNPMVGAVITLGRRVVGEGYHRRCGEPHAEVIAIEKAGRNARGATVYVTLEPCAHFGKTPPCVDALIDAGVARVVVAAVDPDARVNGAGINALRRAGIRVDVGCLRAEAVADNLCYFHDRLAAGASVTLKMAVTSDGFVARRPGSRDRITGEASLRRVHAMRAMSDAVVVGVETAIVDRPRLDCRLFEPGPGSQGPVPTPVVLDTSLRLPPQNAWSAEGREYVVVCGDRVNASRRRAHERAGARVVECASGEAGVDVRSAVEALADLGFARLLVEGGPGVFRSFLDADCWSALYVFESGVRFGHGGVALNAPEVQSPEFAVALQPERVGSDVLRRWLHPESLRVLGGGHPGGLSCLPE